MKRCSKCGEEKLFEGFTRDRKSPDGYAYACRECYHLWYLANQEKSRLYAQQWREANRESAREARRQRYETNPEKHRAFSRNWRKANPEKRRESTRLYYEKNRDRKLQYQQANLGRRRESDRRWRAKFPERHLAKVHKHRAAVAAAGGRGITAEDIQAMIYIQQGLCFYCERDGQKLTLDHVIPITKNGLHDVDNAVMCCGPCNSSKGDRTPEQWIEAGRWFD